MALVKKTFVDQVSVDEFGNVSIRWKKAVMEDGKLYSFEYHRTNVQPGDDVTAQLIAVENHLESMGAARPDLSDRDLPIQIAAIAHTPEKIAERRAREAANKARMENPSGQQPN